MKKVCGLMITILAVLAMMSCDDGLDTGLSLTTREMAETASLTLAY